LASSGGRLHLRDQDRGHNELRASIEGVLGVLDVHDGAAANHDVAAVLRAEVGDGVEAARRRESELHNLEATVNGRLHRLRRCLRGRCTENGARTVLQSRNVVRKLFLQVHAWDSQQSATALRPASAATETGTAMPTRRSRSGSKWAMFWLLPAEMHC
jgi:hypothetical protein